MACTKDHGGGVCTCPRTPARWPEPSAPSRPDPKNPDRNGSKRY